MSRTSLTILVLAATLLAGCQKAPTEQVTAAQKALETARSTEADKYAPDQFGQAQKDFSEAANEIKAQDGAFFLTRDYSKAEQLLKDTLAKAQTAQTAATRNKETMKNEVETLITETEAAIETAKADLQKAPRGKDTKAELDAMRADLDATAAALADAREMNSKGDYIGAKSSLSQSKEKATQISGEIEMARQKVKGARRQSAKS